MGKEVNPIEVVDLEDDFNIFTPISIRGTTNRDAISVERYAEDRDLHRAIMASHLQAITGIIDLSNHYGDDEDDDILVVQARRSKRPCSNSRTPSSVSELGQPSNSKESEKGAPFVCEICVEEKPRTELFRIKGCVHSYCSECVSRYVASKLQENSTLVSCPAPGCEAALDPEHCRAILPPEVFDRWGYALCESAIVASHKFYCPYRDCSALFIDDGDGEGGPTVTQFECPNCRKSFCVQCRVPWHSGFSCEGFKKLKTDERGREDLMLMDLAKAKKWIRCPGCGFYVEKSQGCVHMKCRCGARFCYGCGKASCCCYERR